MAGRTRLLGVHRDLLERWRTRMNLVGPGDVGVHYADSQAALDVLGEPAGHWADLGTGAGFPGIVLAARFPQLTVDLVDSRQKRCVFLEEVLGKAGLTEGVRVRCERVEDLPDASYDGITARAFAPPEAVLEHAARLLRPGGWVVLFLQDDGAELPRDERFRGEATRRYEVEGKRRRAVLLSRA